MHKNGIGNGTTPLDAEWESDFREHFFYFLERYNADAAAERLLAKGWKVQVTQSAVRGDWLLLATDPAPSDDDFEDLYRELEGLAKEFDGEYDGWGSPL